VARRDDRQRVRRRPFGERLCRLVVNAFATVYLVALILAGLALIDPFGLIPRILIGVLLIVLGWPWTLFSAAFGDDIRPLVSALFPTLNWLILGFICAWRRLKPKLPDEDEIDEPKA